MLYFCKLPIKVKAPKDRKGGSAEGKYLFSVELLSCLHKANQIGSREKCYAGPSECLLKKPAAALIHVVPFFRCTSSSHYILCNEGRKVGRRDMLLTGKKDRSKRTVRVFPYALQRRWFAPDLQCAHELDGFLGPSVWLCSFLEGPRRPYLLVFAAATCLPYRR